MRDEVYAYHEWPNWHVMEILRDPWDAGKASKLFGTLFEFCPDGRVRVWVKGVCFDLRDPLL